MAQIFRQKMTAEIEAAGQYECIYSGMPLIGLAKAAKHVSVLGAGDSARGRMAAGAPAAS